MKIPFKFFIPVFCLVVLFSEAKGEDTAQYYYSPQLKFNPLQLFNEVSLSYEQKVSRLCSIEVMAGRVYFSAAGKDGLSSIFEELTEYKGLVVRAGTKKFFEGHTKYYCGIQCMYKYLHYDHLDIYSDFDDPAWNEESKFMNVGEVAVIFGSQSFDPGNGVVGEMFFGVGFRTERGETINFNSNQLLPAPLTQVFNPPIRTPFSNDFFVLKLGVKIGVCLKRSKKTGFESEGY